MKLRMTPLAMALSLASISHVTYADEAEPDTSSTLPVVRIKAKSDSPTDLSKAQAGGQIASGAQLGAKGNQDVMEIPFSVTAYTADLIQNKQARTVADVLAADPSVRFTTSNGHMYENFRVRGFDVNAGDISLNGMFGLTPVGHVPAEFIERVELLKGPSALFSGMPPAGGVGGVINIVPKRAKDDPVTQFTLGIQSDAHVFTHADVGRRFGDNQAYGLRINAATGNGDTTLDGQSKQRQFLSSAFDYRSAELLATVDAYHSNESFKGGTPAMYWFASTPVPAAPDPRLNPFRAGYGNLTSDAIIARADWMLNEQVSVFAGAGAHKHTFSGFINGTHAREIQANGDFWGVMVGQNGYQDSVSAEAGLRASLQTAGIRHALLVHASRLNQESGTNVNRARFTSNIYRPVVAGMVAIPAPADKTGENRLGSLALIDTISTEDKQLSVTLGARQQQVKTTSFNAGKITASYDEQRLTPALALVYQPFGSDISLYANAVEGLSPGETVTDTAATNYQQVFKPYQTRQKEIGVKWQDGALQHTFSLFDLRKPTLIALGSSSKPTYSDDGEKQVRGLEWASAGEIHPGMRILAGATYSRGEQTRTAYNLYNGKDAVGAPRWQGTLGAEWDTAWVSGLTLDGRLTATSAQYVDAANTQSIPGWSQFDAGMRYNMRIHQNQVVLRLNISNLFDRHFYSGSFSDSTPIATLGPARSVTASATVNF
ncbi:TonB-dependent siderophore receptor [Burkholderiaceae bacterium DAT-1]|nr:TonB-dependent siderophore receptor [Burkholderiaceae bacterium DAT-1]